MCAKKSMSWSTCQQPSPYQISSSVEQLSKPGSSCGTQPGFLSGTLLKESNVKERIRAIKASINNREVLIAANEGNFDKVKQLIENENANVYFVDEGGNTALHYAVESKAVDESGLLKVIELLCNKMDDISIENNENETPLDIGRRLKNQSIVELLVQKKVIASSLDLLKKCVSRQKECASNRERSLTFVDAMFSRNYKYTLTKADVNNILKINFIRKCDQVFEAISYEQLVKLDFKSLTPKINSFIIDLGEFQWATLVVIRGQEKGKFDVHCVCPSDQSDKMEAALKLLTNEKYKLKLQKQENKVDSVIFALKNIDRIHFNLNGSSKLEEEFKKCAPVYEREFFANMLNEEKRTKDKIKSCLAILKDINSNADNIKNFTHKNANAFILFLETFALEDTHMMTSETDKEKRKILEKRIKKWKKEHFAQYYFQGEKDGQKSDIQFIESVRSRILHYSQMLEPADFSNFKSRNISISEFFQSLKLFTEAIDKKVGGKLEVNEKIIIKNCNAFLAPLEKGEYVGKEINLLQEFSKLVKYIYTSQEKIGQDELEKIIFDLTVNIIPVLDNQKLEVRPLTTIRNCLIHNFHKYEINERFEEIKKELIYLRSSLFKYYYSKEIHELLKTISPDMESINIEEKLYCRLRDFEKEFDKKSIVVSGQETKKTFEYIFKESLFPEKDEDIEGLVDQYLKFMVIIHGEEREKTEIDGEERNENQNEGEVEKNKILQRYKELSDVERREIFEDFVKLKHIRTYSSNQYKGKENELKEKLKNMCGVKEDYFDETISLHADCSDLIDHDKLKEIVGVLTTLKKIKIDHRLFNEDIVLLYKCFIEEKGFFNVDKYQDLLENLKKQNLTQSQKECIQVKLSNLPKSGIINIQVGTRKKFKIDALEVIGNMFKIFYNSYHKYQMKFNNVEEAFNDQIFLDYLVADTVEQSAKEINPELKNKYQLFMIIKKLIKIDYTAPYIASIIIKIQSDDVIEKDDMIKLIEILLEKDLYATHLNALLNVKSQKPGFNLYEVVCRKILEEKNINMESLRSIFKEPKHVKGILSTLGKKTDQFSVTAESNIKKILELLNNIAYELHCRGCYGNALEMLDSEDVKAVRNKLINGSDDLCNLKAKYRIAKAKTEQGRTAKNKEKLYEEVLNILYEIRNCDAPMHLLILSEIAYIKCLLKEYKESNEDYEILFNKIYKFVFDLPDNLKIENMEYSKIKDSNKYQNLLSFSEESEKYLEVLNIKSAIVYNKIFHGKLEFFKKDYKNALVIYDEALKISEEIYNDGKKSLGLKSNVVVMAMRDIVLLNINIAEILSWKMKDKHLEDALLYYYKSIEKNTKFYTNQKNMFWSCHPAVTKTKYYINRALFGVASVYVDLAERKQYKDRLKYYEKAYEICNKLYEVQINVFGEGHDLTLRTAEKIRVIKHNMSMHGKCFAYKRH